MVTRQQKALRTKKKILETALKAFKEKSFNEVTVNEILVKANSSKGAFYTHFKSKHDIFMEKFKEIDDYYVDVLLEKVEMEPTCSDKLSTFFRMQMAYIENDLGWDVVRTIYEVELNTERESFFLLPNRPLYRILTGIFQDGQQNGEFRTDLTIETMLNLCVRIMRGILYDWSLHRADYSLEVEQELLFQMMIKEFKRK